MASERAGLRVVATREHAASPEWAPVGPAAARPGDRRESFAAPWAAVRAVAEAAAEVGLPTDLAAALAVERRLVVDDLTELYGRVGAEPLCALLDDEAAEATVSRPLSPATSRYLRVLTSGPAPRAADAGGLALPVRLLERVSGPFVASACDNPCLSQAVAWEIAATLTGRTMTEWAAWTTLAASAR